MMELLERAVRERLLRPLDLQFARMIAPDDCPLFDLFRNSQRLMEIKAQDVTQEQHHRVGAARALLQLTAAYLSAETGAGHICLPITGLQPQHLFDGRQSDLAQALWKAAGEPSTQQWRETLQDSFSVSDGSQPTPLVLQHDRLYLQRMWQNEGDVARFIVNGNANNERVDEILLQNILEQLFGTNGDEVDWQKVAAAATLTRRISIISGGPGTGKTTTVAKLLTALVRLNGEQRVRIQLVAPTGKAAARLTESLGKAWQQLALNESEHKLFPNQAFTLHSLLGVQPNRHRLRYHSGNPLNLDVLVVDEASMVDLPMMAKLIAALPTHARVIFLGDRDQLASVEAGAVFGDICRFVESGYSVFRAEQLARVTGYPLEQLNNPHDMSKRKTLTTGLTEVSDGLCLLRKSYRFDKKSGIGQLAQAVNAGAYLEALSVLNGNYTDVERFVLANMIDYQQLLQVSVAGYQPYLKLVAQGADAAEILTAFNHYQLLCALRAGSFGVKGLNPLIEQVLQRNGLIQRTQGLSGRWYAGRPVMIERNDSALGLSNGDVGIALYDAHGHLRVHFQLPNGTIKSVQPNRLPSHGTAYAMTIHKSQGSEFEHTALVLPDYFSPIITRELLYTGITRARQQLTLYTSDSVLSRAINTPTLRHSGLVDRLCLATLAKPNSAIPLDVVSA
ncbi:exodeoxyribonuclease V subunit alpha [Candidatus Fukatsuia endosymbiont of Tuberolachnus salignus]|uniref:exodeoxyribonuclease V subunit alpha n=1 Tax=Candidatus Fukatsuia endosymbiont of Tuberolachnus salignus TaxID=3077957 RepID=UPI00313E671E